MLRRKVAHIVDATAAQRRGAAFAQPRFRIGLAVEDLDCDRFVIAFQRDDAIGPLRLQLDERFDYPAAVRTAIDVVAKEDEGRGSAAGMLLAQHQQIAQFLQRAVNVSDRVEKRRLADVGRGVRAEMAVVFGHDRSVRVHQDMGTSGKGAGLSRETRST
jgi:hypothetical protein